MRLPLLFIVSQTESKTVGTAMPIPSHFISASQAKSFNSQKTTCKFSFLRKSVFIAPKIFIQYRYLSFYFATVSSDKAKELLLTRFDIPANPIADINSAWFLAGSCFSENMGRMLGSLSVETLQNPFGIIYNPHSLANILGKIATEYRYSVHDFYYSGGRFVSLDHHGSFSHPDAAPLADRINLLHDQSFEFISQAQIACITLGTARVWEMHDPARIVANCHKIPASEFQNRMLSETEIRQELFNCVEYLRMMNPDIKVLFTVSPVKHLREGIVSNSISKARLLSALSSFLDDMPECAYFPAYEIVTEELRDHRFYADDLAHPSAWTIRYIFSRFSECYFNSHSRQYLDAAIRLARLLEHRPHQTDNASLSLIKQKWADEIAKIKASFPEKTHWAAFDRFIS